MLTMGRTQRPALAEPYARQALALDPDSIGTRYHLGKMYATQGRHADAVVEYRVVVQKGNAFMQRTTRPELVEELLAAGDAAGARVEAERMTADPTVEPEHWLLQYRVLDALGAPERWEALQHYLDTVDRNSPGANEIGQYDELMRAHRAQGG
jgi:Tfp pilus assembly protein PilF